MLNIGLMVHVYIRDSVVTILNVVLVLIFLSESWTLEVLECRLVE